MVFFDSSELDRKLHNCSSFMCTDRCQSWEKDMEIKELKEQLNELVLLLKQSETQRKDLIRDQKMREQAVAIALVR